MLEFLLVYADSVETTDEKIRGAEMHVSYIDILITIKSDCCLIKSRERRYRNQEKGLYTKHGRAGIPKLYRNYHADEAPPDEVVNQRSQ